jgi:23S rRNA (cytidine2498-2'-O)-methyltransferase
VDRENLNGRIYQAVQGFEDHLQYELGSSLSGQWGDLYYAQSAEDGGGIPCLSNQKYREPGKEIFWQLNEWLEPFRLHFSSISEASGALREIQRNWALLPFASYRRAVLIQSKLPPLASMSKPRPFPWQLPETPLGAFSLLDENTLIASASCSSPFPAGRISFVEDREGPPSRAYLKLWEALTRLREWPRPGERCLDAGASPGGWTWALAQLGAEVVAVDRSPLEERVAVLPRVQYIRHDAFTMKPEDLGPMDWVFSDVISYPDRLYDWVEKWLASGLCSRFVCTIKWQGDRESLGEYFAVSRRFAALPGSRVLHLFHNKHELCWMLPWKL